jgi:hypothetical protein
LAKDTIQDLAKMAKNINVSVKKPLENGFYDWNNDISTSWVYDPVFNGITLVVDLVGSTSLYVSDKSHMSSHSY